MPTKKSVTKKKPSKAKVEIQAETPTRISGKYFYAKGKRKTSIAKVYLSKGTGEIKVNGRAVNEYFPIKTLVGVIRSPLKLTGAENKYDISAKVIGGGISSQADAICHGVSKALMEADPLSKPTLKRAGMLTRDSRIKERKKYGLHRARRAPQFSKR
ncbi:MAG: 30S ribosomal protein S9 [Candidatus Gracilibacteria bacterium]